MEYAHIEGGRIIWLRRYREPIDEATLTRKSIVPVIEDKPPIDQATQLLEGPTLVVEPGRVVRRYTVRDKTFDELWADAREKRKAEYIARLPDRGNDPLEAIADVLDRVLIEDQSKTAWQIKAIQDIAAHTGATIDPLPPTDPGFAEKMAIINEVKSQFPNPPRP